MTDKLKNKPGINADFINVSIIRRRYEAIRIHEFGLPEVMRYEETDVPELQAGEVLVSIKAAGVIPLKRTSGNVRTR